ncbi:hypothetical protein ACFL43_00345 [Thermodesulfobacteriota bacterium]
MKVSNAELQLAKDYFYSTFAEDEKYKEYRLDNNIDNDPRFLQHYYNKGILKRIAGFFRSEYGRTYSKRTANKLLWSNCKILNQIVAYFLKSNSLLTRSIFSSLFVYKKRDFTLHTNYVHKNKDDEYYGAIITYNVGLQNLSVFIVHYFAAFFNIENNRRAHKKSEKSLRQIDLYRKAFNASLIEYDNNGGEFYQDNEDAGIKIGIFSSLQATPLLAFQIGHEASHYMAKAKSIPKDLGVDGLIENSNIEINSHKPSNLEITCDVVSLVIMFATISPHKVNNAIGAIRGSVLTLTTLSVFESKIEEVCDPIIEARFDALRLILYQLMDRFQGRDRLFLYSQLSYLLHFQHELYLQSKRGLGNYLEFYLKELDEHWSKM